MKTDQWAPPCNSRCNNKYTAVTQIPWRIFCKKGCDADGETWEGCLGECDEMCYKDPVFKNQKWSSYIDRSPGSASYSEECFRACISGCAYKFDVPQEKTSEVHSREPKPEPEATRTKRVIAEPPGRTTDNDEIANTSA